MALDTMLNKLRERERERERRKRKLVEQKRLILLIIKVNYRRLQKKYI